MPHIHPVSDLKTNLPHLTKWFAEIEERYRSIKDGTVTCIPADDAMRQARERIRRRPGYWRKRLH